MEIIAQRYQEDVTFVCLISPRLVNLRKKLQFEKYLVSYLTWMSSMVSILSSYAG